MKKTKVKILITSVLLVALVLACLPSNVYAAIYQAGMSLFSGMTEEEIYEMKKQSDEHELISEIISLEKSLPSTSDKTAILPHLMALIEKSHKFTADELITLIKSDQTDAALESALVQMYIDKGADSAKLIQLLDNNDISEDTKVYIVATGDFSTAELSSIFTSYDDDISVVAMKRITAISCEEALSLALNVLNGDAKDATDEKCIAAFLGFAAYCESNSNTEAGKVQMSTEKKQSIISLIKTLYATSSNERVKDQAIYALARIADYDLFAYIIESEDIDFDLKVTTVERNIGLLLEIIASETALSEKMDVIIEAMEILPVAEVGEALQLAVDEGRLDADESVSNVIDYIEAEGLEGIYKYEK